MFSSSVMQAVAPFAALAATVFIAAFPSPRDFVNTMFNGGAKTVPSTFYVNGHPVEYEVHVDPEAPVAVLISQLELCSADMELERPHLGPSCQSVIEIASARLKDEAATNSTVSATLDLTKARFCRRQWAGDLPGTDSTVSVALCGQT